MVETRSLGQDEEDEPREMVAVFGDIHRDTKDETCDILSKGIKDAQIHIVLEPIEPSEWKDQHLFLKDSPLVTSSLWEVVEQFEELDMVTMKDVVESEDNVEIFQRIKNNLEGKQVRFKEKKYGRSERLNWFPLEVVG